MDVTGGKRRIAIMLVLCAMSGAFSGNCADSIFPLQTDVPLPTDICETAANETTESSPTVTIELAGTYDSVTRTVELRAIVCTYEALPAGTRISVVAVEDSPVVQSDAASSGEILQPVIRKLVTGPSGEPLADAVIPKDVCLMKRYSCKLDLEWNKEKCAIVVIVHMDGEMLQAGRIEMPALTP